MHLTSDSAKQYPKPMRIGYFRDNEVLQEVDLFSSFWAIVFMVEFG